MGKVLRRIDFLVNSTVSVATTAVQMDYRFDGTPVRTIFVSNAVAVGNAVAIEIAPGSTGPWVPIASIASTVTATAVPFEYDVPYIRVNGGGGGDVTVIGII